MTARLLLINCYRENAEKKIEPYREWIQAGARDLGLKLEILAKFDHEPLAGGDDDGLIVSGSRQMVGRGQIEAGLIDFLRTNRRPLLGICYGYQALVRAFGGSVGKDAATHRGDETIHLEAPDALFAGFPASFPMSESHEEIVARDEALEKEFRVLAVGGSGLVEAVRRRDLPLYGVQFHPERSGDPGRRLLANFLGLIPQTLSRRVR